MNDIEEKLKRAVTTISYQPFNNLAVVKMSLIVKASELASYDDIYKLLEGWVVKKVHPRINYSKIVAYGYNVYGLELDDDVDIRDNGIKYIILPENTESFKLKKAMLGKIGNLKLAEGSKVYHRGVEMDVPEGELLDIKGEPVLPKEGTSIFGDQNIEIIEYGTIEAFGVLGIFKNR